MIVHLSTVFSLVLLAFTLSTSAAAINQNVSLNVSDVVVDLNSSPASPSDSLLQLNCCAGATNHVFIQPACSYLHHRCGGWNFCGLPPNDRQWCRYCIVNHPEDHACLERTWPPAYPAPISRRDLDGSTIAPPEQLDLEKEQAKDTEELAPETIKELESPQEPSETGLIPRAPSSSTSVKIKTKNTPGIAQSFTRSVALVTFNLIVSANNIITFSLENSGALNYYFEVKDLRSGWAVKNTISSGQTVGGTLGPKPYVEGGDEIKWYLRSE